MGIKPDQTSYSSDYFEEMYQYCVKMIHEGKACRSFSASASTLLVRLIVSRLR